jgi:hypothetical protein
MTNIKGIDKVKLIQELYKKAKVQGLGFLASNFSGELSINEATNLLDKYMDYVHCIIYIQ